VLAVVAREQGKDMRLELPSRRLHASAPSSYSTRYAGPWVSGFIVEVLMALLTGQPSHIPSGFRAIDLFLLSLELSAS